MTSVWGGGGACWYKTLGCDCFSASGCYCNMLILSFLGGGGCAFLRGGGGVKRRTNCVGPPYICLSGGGGGG